MSKRSHPLDSRQLPLPLGPQAGGRGLRAGALRAKEAVREALSRALEASGLEREEVAAQLSRLVGEQVSVHTLHSYTAESKGERRLPLEYAGALAVILNDASLVGAALTGSGLAVVGREELDLMEYGRLQLERRKLGRKERQLMERLGG